MMLVGVQGSLFHIAAGSHPVQGLNSKITSMLSKTMPTDSSYHKTIPTDSSYHNDKLKY